jgi:hypothetical protein
MLGSGTGPYAKGLSRRPSNLIAKGVNRRRGDQFARQEAMMTPSRWFRVPGFWFLAGATLFSLHSQSLASINQTGALLVPTATAAKSCSGAFRYAARVGNSDIVTISPVQLFAEDRRLTKTRYTSRAMAGFGSERSPVLSSNTMC